MTCHSLISFVLGIVIFYLPRSTKKGARVLSCRVTFRLIATLFLYSLTFVCCRYFLSAVTADRDRSIDDPIASWGGVEYPDVDLRRWSFQGTFANDKPIAGFLRSPCPLSAELNVSMRRKR